MSSYTAFGIRNGYYSVRPRYSCGSGALVDERTALGVKKDELTDYERHLDGSYGEAKARFADANGLAGIVTFSNDYTTYDILTEQYICRVCQGSGNGKRTACRKCDGRGRWTIENGEKIGMPRD